MAHAEFPEEIARDNKHAGDDGQKHRAGIVVAANEVHQRVILHERVGDDVGAERLCRRWKAGSARARAYRLLKY